MIHWLSRVGESLTHALGGRSRGVVVGVAGAVALTLVLAAILLRVGDDTSIARDAGRFADSAVSADEVSPNATEVTAESKAGSKTVVRTATDTDRPQSSLHVGLASQMKRYVAAQQRLARTVSARFSRRTAPVSFRIGSFNILGASHTGAGGHRNDYPTAGARMGAMIGVLRGQGVEVVGFQEFEASQYYMFRAQAPEFDLYPGLSLGDKSVRFNIAWRSDEWRLIEGRSISIPYAGGSRIDMPVVLLENLDTGRRAWFANFHNPADTPRLGGNARWRAMGAAIEVDYLSDLHLETGLPVLVTGDFNERAELFCRFTAGGIFSSASGGSNGGYCSPPAQMQVDWVFGSTNVEFSGYAVTGSGRASDHDLVHSQAMLLSEDPPTSQ